VVALGNWELCESRGSRTVLREAEGEVPSAYSLIIRRHVGGNNFTYNDNGCLIDDGIFDYTYDTENQLVEADDGSTTTTYIYDRAP